MNIPVRDIAAELGKRHFGGFRVLPYNRHNDSAINASERWWLTPTSDNPAFPPGKVVATKREAWVEPGSVFVGFNVEKGVLDKAVRGNAYVLKDDWLWHEFVRDAGRLLCPKLTAAASVVGTRIRIIIGCSTEPPRGVQADPGDILQFESDGSELSLVDESGRMEFLGETKKVRTYADLGRELIRMTTPSFGYQWIDVLIGTHFTMSPEGKDDLAVAAAMLEPFRSWMRRGRCT